MGDPPVSVKAALRCGDRWVLLRNDRGEWELPGGRIEAGDSSLAAALARECREELGIEVEVGRLVDCWLFEVVPGRQVVIVCFEAAADQLAELAVSDEHLEIGCFRAGQLPDDDLPVGYRLAIERCVSRAGRMRS